MSVPPYSSMTSSLSRNLTLYGTGAASQVLPFVERAGTSTERRTTLRNAARLVAGNRPEIPPRPAPAIAAAQAMFSATLYGVPRGVARSY